MRQVTFSSQSLDAISGLPQVGQLSLIEKLSSLSSDILAKKMSGVGKFVHKGKIFYRIRMEDMRIYLEQMGTPYIANLYSKKFLSGFYGTL